MPKTYQSIVLDVPIDQVWERVSDFHDITWAVTIVTSCESEGDQGTREVGAKRVINGVIKETLKTMDPDDHRLSYCIEDAPSPISKDDVSNYLGTIRLLPVTIGNRTFVEWYSEWESPTDDAVEFCKGAYDGLLKDLAKSFE